MQSGFHAFSMAHLAVLAAVPLLGAVLALVHRRVIPGTRWVRIGLAVVLILDTILWYVDLGFHGQLTFPERMPLELCDATLFLMIVSLLVKSSALFDLAYFTALAGATMALLTPNVFEPFPAIATIQFFLAHGLVVVSVLFLVWSGQQKPRPGSVLKAMIGINVYAAFVGLFDWIFKTDFMYLRAKPVNASLLDLLGPWPWYLAATEGVALALFLLLYFPFYLSGRKTV